MKNIRTDDDGYAYQASLGSQGTVVPFGGTINARIETYESFVNDGSMPKPLEIRKVADGLYDILVFPRSAKTGLCTPIARTTAHKGRAEAG